MQSTYTLPARVPMKQFVDQLTNMDSRFPYKIEFSFAKYIRKLQASYETSQSPVLKTILDTFIEAEQQLTNAPSTDCALMKSGISDMLMPSMMYEHDKVFISEPLTYSFKKVSRPLQSFIDDENWEIEAQEEYYTTNKMIINAGLYILRDHYNIEGLEILSERLMFRHKITNQIKMEEINLKLDFVDIEYDESAPKLTKEEIKLLLENVDDIDLWLQLLPPEHFKFSGFIIGNFIDVSATSIISLLRKENNKIDDYEKPELIIQRISSLFQSYLRDFDMQVGIANIRYVELLNKDSVSLSLTGVLDIKKMTSSKVENGVCIYCDAIYRKKNIILEDIDNKDLLSSAEEILNQKGIKSVILIPVIDDDGRVFSIIELGSTRPLGVNSVTLVKLEEMIDILKEMVFSYAKEVDKEVSILIRNQFTNIHPSVEWKFKEVATRYHLNLVLQNESLGIEPIKFENVFPLYGQADIVGSSKSNIKALKADLRYNLESIVTLLDSWLSMRPLFLLQNYKTKAETHLEKINEDFSASDETAIIDFLVSTVHPHLEELSARHNEFYNKEYIQYQRKLDQELGIVYMHRRTYDVSVNELNKKLSDFFQKSNKKLQKTLPHFFEKYKTDGVQYNIYLGQSILKEGHFSMNDLKEFRIWQLKNMIEATQLVNKVSPKLDTPLETAQLIFVYNTDLNIRFRMEEKRFDVDGAYNVRYEIIKKRIDKATISGTNERLTLPNTISIVYLQDKDRREYDEYIEFFIKERLLSPEVEHLELNRLPGADGLKAIRLTLA